MEAFIHGRHAVKTGTGWKIIGRGGCPVNPLTVF
jgi:hypothetical protein